MAIGETSGGTNPVDVSQFLDPTGGAIAAIVSLLRLLGTPPDAPDRPVKAFEHPVDAAQQTVRGVYWALQDLGSFSAFSWAMAYIAGTIVLLGGVIGELLLWLFKNVLPEIAGAGLDYIDAFRKTLDPQVAGVAVQVLNELLGTDYSELELPAGEDVDAHIARAGKIGKLFFDTVTREIAPGGDIEEIDGQAGAAQFAGMIINFGVATALLGIAGELSSAGLFKDFRLIGEQVSSGLGLSKQMRIAMRPLMKTLVATPFQWQLNRQFHPARFSVGDVVNPFQQTLMDHDTIVKDLELQGWDHDRAEQLIKLHSKKIPLADLELLDRYGITDRSATISLMKELGFPEDIASIVLQSVDLQRGDAALRGLVGAAEASVVDGHLTIEDFSALLDSLPLGTSEKKFVLAAVAFKVKAPHAHLTVAQAENAFKEGLWTLDELEAYFAVRGYSARDNSTLQLLTLLALAQFDEAKKVAQFNYDRRVEAAKAKNKPVPPPPPILAR